MKKIGVESGNRGWGIDVSRTRIAVGSLAGSGAPSIRYTPTIKPSLRGLVRSIRKYTRWTPIKFARARDDDGARGRVRGGGRRARGAGPYVPRAVCNVRHDPTRSATYIPENFPFFFFSISPALRPPVRNPHSGIVAGAPAIPADTTRATASRGVLQLPRVTHVPHAPRADSLTNVETRIPAKNRLCKKP